MSVYVIMNVTLWVIYFGINALREFDQAMFRSSNVRYIYESPTQT